MVTTALGNTLAIVLAGGAGNRLMPLTANRAKPAVPFGGHYRLIDFVLSNLVNSQIFRIMVLTQYQSYSLIRHLARGWSFSPQLNQFCEIIPATEGRNRGWYLGSADALWQNMSYIRRDRPRFVAVFGADHIYRMDIRQMIVEHDRCGADVSVACIPQPRSESSQFGCIGTADGGRIVSFVEKPPDPPPMPGRSDMSLVSMGNYIFNLDILEKMLAEDSADASSAHDIGKNLLPRWVDRAHLHAYDFSRNIIPGNTPHEVGYWRDVGTIDAYWKASMDLIQVSPDFNLYNSEWPIITAHDHYPPSKYVFADRESSRIGVATDSLVCDGVIVSGGHIDRSILSPRVRINSFSTVSESILFEGVQVGRRCRLRKVIVDKNVKIPPDMVIGYDPDLDRSRGFTVTENGIVVVPASAALS